MDTGKAKGEVLRYLGHSHQEIDQELNQRIDAAMVQCRELSRPAYTVQVAECRALEGEILLGGTIRLRGESIYGHLGQAKKAAVLGATLGVALEQAIRRYEYTDMTYALLLDASATQLIEEVCDEAEDEVKALAAREGLVTNFRFSPGYGDLSLEVQPDLLRLLDAVKTIGLTCTDTLILTPRKSVTAIIGLLEPGMGTKDSRGCAFCALRDTCLYRKQGITCYRDRNGES